MPANRAVIIQDAGDAPPRWPGAVLGLLSASAEPAASVEALRGILRDSSCVLVDGRNSDAIERVRRAHRADPTVQAVIVAPAADHPRLARAILFTPGIGEVWLLAPEDLDPGLVQRAAGVTSSRRAYRQTQTRLAHGLASMQVPRDQRAVISDAYLAALLEAVPDPVISVDSAGIVLSWNPGAERVLGHERGDAVGRPLARVLASPDGASWLDLDLFDPAVPRRREIRFRRRNGDEGIGEMIVVPVEAAAQRVRAVILHDLTAERGAQSEMEDQAAALEAQAEELQQQAAELEQVNDELQDRTAALEHAARARDRFYAAMSHELRTPINAVLGFLDLVLTGIYGPLADEQAEALLRAQRAARHLHELVDDVLDLARIEAGRMEIKVEETWLPQVIEEVVETVRGMADQAGSELSVDGPAAHRIRADPRRLRQILLNLLSNAINFGLGRPIRVRWTVTRDGGVQIDVTDQGVGIEAANLDRIFDEFSQAASRPGGGTGLGLPISQRLANLLGGSLDASSSPGQGTTFRLTLPHSTPEQPAA